MDFFPLLKSKKNAMIDCQDTPRLPQPRRQLIKQNLKLLNYGPYVIKGSIILTILFGVNWKRQVPMTKRQIPLAIGAFCFSAIADYLLVEYVWSQHESQVTKLTGFKNGIYVSPERMQKMRRDRNNKVIDIEQQLIIEQDI